MMFQEKNDQKGVIMRPTFTDRYFYIWAYFIPITSFLLIPSIQGTTVGYIMAFLTLTFPFLFLFRGRSEYYVRDVLIFVGVWVFFFALSQAGLTVADHIDFKSARLVDPFDDTILMRKTLFTQSLYLFAGALTFIFVKHYYNDSWDKHLFRAITFFVLYGVYEFIFYLVTGQNGDFISNRVFRDGYPGSLFQTMNIGDFSIMRIKSLSGEPSMYSFTVLPFWIYTLHKKRKIHWLLLLTMLMTLSSTALVGVVTYGLYRVFKHPFVKKWMVIAGLSMMSLVVVFWGQLYPILDAHVFSKFTLESVSGKDRFDSLVSSLEMYVDLPLWNQLFGVGFGYIRSTDLFSTLLVNIGMFGFLLYTLLFLYPLVRKIDFELKAALLAIYTTSMGSVPEFGYLSSWVFLGMAYCQIRLSRSTQPFGVDNAETR